jgi:hypothetical protein
MNPTAVLVIEKDTGEVCEGKTPLCDPITRGELVKGESSYFSKDSLIAYPIVEQIPCLNIDNGILATKYLD